MTDSDFVDKNFIDSPIQRYNKLRQYPALWGTLGRRLYFQSQLNYTSSEPRTERLAREATCLYWRCKSIEGGLLASISHTCHCSVLLAVHPCFLSPLRR